MTGKTLGQAWLALMSACTAANALAVPAAATEPELKAGQSAVTGDLLVQCLGDRVRVVPSNGTRGLPVRQRRGPLQSSSVDCRLADGTAVRVKSGQVSQPLPWGMCGGTPGEQLSVWIARRKVLSSFEYASFCEDVKIRSLEIRRATASVCIPPPEEHVLHADNFGKLRERGLDGDGCAALPLPRAAVIDTREFPAAGTARRQVDTITLEASAAMRPACERLMPSRLGADPAVPASLPHPDWQRRRVDLPQPDVTAVGFNATTLSLDGSVESAAFDLENSGRVDRVDRQESTNHWFDGTALAIDAPGVLTVPYDAHDEAAALRKGIHVWTYDHAQVFFDHGRTYVLLNPVTHAADSRVVALHGKREETVCTFRRTQDHF